MSIFPILVQHAMLGRGCGLTVAEQVIQAISERPEKEAEALWLRIQGKSYQEIAEILELNKGSVWRIIHGPVKRTVYSIIERAMVTT